MVQLETVIPLQTVLVIKSNYYYVECFVGLKGTINLLLTTARKGCFYTVKPSDAYPLRINS